MRQVRWLWSIVAILSLVLAACSSGAPSGPTTGGAASGGAAQKNPVDDVVLPKGVELTFWHAQSGPAKDLLDSLVVFAGVGDEWLGHAITISTEASNSPETRVKQLVQLFWMAGLKDRVEDRLADHLRSEMETTQR